MIYFLNRLVEWIDSGEKEEDVSMVPYKYSKKRFKSELDVIRYMNDIGIDSDAIVNTIYMGIGYGCPWVLIYIYGTPDDMLAAQEVERNTRWEEYFDILNRKYGG